MPSITGMSDAGARLIGNLAEHTTLTIVGGTAVASGVGGGILSYGRGDAQTTSHKFKQAAGFGIAASVAGGTLAIGATTFGKSAVKGIGRSFNASFQEKTLTAALLKHPPMAMSLGAVIGGTIGSQVGDDPVQGAAIGAVAGAASGFAVRAGRNIKTHWGKMPGPVKAMMIATAVVGAGAATRAYTHEDSYTVNDTAVDDGMGGYEARSGPRGPGDRAAAMNASGDVVLGLHRKRH
jgi:hypothetical protein